MARPWEPKDRSKYAALFSRLQQGFHDDERVHVDRVKGGGLRARLEGGKYVGLRGLQYRVESHRTGDGRFDVFIIITGREENP
jgi:hypothetical protein